jgi:hypothetical protein
MIGSLLTLPNLIGVSFASLLAWALHNKYGHGIANIKGPWLAAYTDLWRAWLVWGRRPERTHIALHEKYGPIVRLGPKTVSVSDPETIKIIYALNAGFVKVSLSSPFLFCFFFFFFFFFLFFLNG